MNEPTEFPRVWRISTDAGGEALIAGHSLRAAVAEFESRHPGVWVLRAVDETEGLEAYNGGDSGVARVTRLIGSSLERFERYRDIKRGA